jgi:hypothetical protein
MLKHNGESYSVYPVEGEPGTLAEWMLYCAVKNGASTVAAWVSEAGVIESFESEGHAGAVQVQVLPHQRIGDKAPIEPGTTITAQPKTKTAPNKPDEIDESDDLKNDDHNEPKPKRTKRG